MFRAVMNGISALKEYDDHSDDAASAAHVIGLLRVCGRLPCAFIVLEYEANSQTLAQWLDAQRLAER